MKTLILITTLFAACSASADSCTQIGSSLFCNDASYSTIGSTTFGSDGSSYTRIGNSTLSSPGREYNPSSRSADTIYNPQMEIGSTRYGKDGTSCTRIGGSYFCD